MDNIVKIVEIRNEDDHIECRIAADNFAKMCGFDDIDRVRITTAVSEIVRNVLTHANRGEMLITWDGKMFTVIISDKGPGIENIELAMQDGYSTKMGLGIGLSGSKRLMGELGVYTILGSGTTIVMRKALNARAMGRTSETRPSRARPY